MNAIVIIGNQIMEITNSNVYTFIRIIVFILLVLNKW